MRYKELKELCNKEGCFCPQEFIIRKILANTPEWIRIYYEKELNKIKENESKV